MVNFPDPGTLTQHSAGFKKQNQILFKKLKKMKPAELESAIHILHDRYMPGMDCLSCANCCKSISPAVSDRDVERIARNQRVKPSEVVEKYMERDDEGDYVFRSQPCPFLGRDNYCSVYDARPKACREYPHTDRVRQKQILAITQRNIVICPVVFKIAENLRDQYL